MGATTETGFGWATPVLSYTMACVGAALGLHCTARALMHTGRLKRNWLAAAAMSIGTGVWTMHFIAMLGFAVTGTEIRYDVRLTVFSLLVCVAVVGAGIFVVGYGARRKKARLRQGSPDRIGRTRWTPPQCEARSHRHLCAMHRMRFATRRLTPWAQARS